MGLASKAKYLLVGLLLLLSGCGNGFIEPAPGTPVSTIPQVQIQAVLNTTLISQEDWLHQIEALNHQQQIEFGSDWGTNVVLINTLPSAYNDSKLSIQVMDQIPDSKKRGLVYGYHLGKHAYVDAPVCLQGPEHQWNRTSSHEICEMVVDGAAGTFGHNLGLLFGATNMEICDPVSSDGYGFPDEAGPPILADYTTPSWWNIGPISFSLDGRPIYDHLLKCTAPNQIAPGGK